MILLLPAGKKINCRKVTQSHCFGTRNAHTQTHAKCPTHSVQNTNGPRNNIIYQNDRKASFFKVHCPRFHDVTKTVQLDFNATIICVVKSLAISQIMALNFCGFFFHLTRLSGKKTNLFLRYTSCRWKSVNTFRIYTWAEGNIILFVLFF